VELSFQCFSFITHSLSVSNTGNFSVSRDDASIVDIVIFQVGTTTKRDFFPQGCRELQKSFSKSFGHEAVDQEIHRRI
jgi:hypothetical protein